MRLFHSLNSTPYRTSHRGNLIVSFTCVLILLMSASMIARADPPADWELVGNNPIHTANGAVAHELCSHDSLLIVAYIADSLGTRSARVAEYTGAPNWSLLGPSPSQGAGFVSDAIAVSYVGSTPYVGYSSMFTVHVMERVGSSWLELGAPGYTVACMVHSSLSLVFDGIAPHVVTYGAGGCGLGIDYGYWDGSAWQQHPSSSGLPGQITMNGNGRPDLVITDQAFVGVPESAGTSLIRVTYWNSMATAWTDLVGPIQENTTNGSDEHMSLAADGAGNIYAAWSEEIAVGGKVIYVKRYDPVEESWTLLGGGQVSGPNDATFPSIAVIDGVPWVAYLEDSTGVDMVRVQRFDGGGGCWEQIGSALNIDSTVSAFSPVIGAIGDVPHVAFREGTGSPQDLYVKRYPVGTSPRSLVTIATDPPGLGITADAANYTAPQTFDWVVGTTHNIGTASPQSRNDTLFVFLSWSDGGDTTHSIVVPDTNVTYTASFYRLFPNAVIDSIVDVPNDQGGWVRVYFSRSYYDDVEETQFPIEAYNLHRRVDDQVLIAEILESVCRSERVEDPIDDGKSRLVTLGHRVFLIEHDPRDSSPPGIWEVVETVYAQQQDQYIALAPTLADSSSTIPYTAFYISAHTTTPAVFFDSPVDSGYSVDNIAPGVPQGFVVAYNTGSGNHLSWDPSPDADFQYFRVYRGTNPDFEPGPGNLVHSTASTSWSDPDYDGWNVHYKVTALDHAGNESDAASPGSATGAGDAALPEHYALHPANPNPFNPATVIRYDVPANGGNVTIQIYDVGGRLIQTLVDGFESAGRREVTWRGLNNHGQQVATGVYFYRMTAPGFEETRKMVLMK